jgi:hypothetical protein
MLTSENLTELIEHCYLDSKVFQDIKQYKILVEHSLLLMIWNFNPAAYSLCKLGTICNEDLAIPVPKLFS